MIIFKRVAKLLNEVTAAKHHNLEVHFHMVGTVWVQLVHELSDD